MCQQLAEALLARLGMAVMPSVLLWKAEDLCLGPLADSCLKRYGCRQKAKPSRFVLNSYFPRKKMEQ